MLRSLIVLILLTLANPPALALDGGSIESQSFRSTAKTGIVLGLNDPVPAVFGVSLGYNVFDFFRLTAGIGRFNSDYNYGGYVIQTKSFTYGGGARLLMPGWNLTPVVGLSWATIVTEGFPNDDHHVYAVLGLEWQTSYGLNLAAGYEQSFNSQIGGLPYLTVGWYFPVL